MERSQRAPTGHVRTGVLSVVSALGGLSLFSSLVVGCAASHDDEPRRISAPIFGGTLDTVDMAVVALLHETFVGAYGCSGTTIAAANGTAYLLTAAHCVASLDGNAKVLRPAVVARAADLTVVPTLDYQQGFAVGPRYGAVSVVMDPGYDGTVTSPHDVAIVRYGVPGTTTPAVPILEVAQDGLSVGSPLTLVGYGRTETDDHNTQRRRVERTISSLTPDHITTNQTDLKGACNGDSGGPALFQTAEGVRVAGVVSYGDTGCSVLGVSVRVSALAAFVHGVIDERPAVDAGADASPTTDAAAPTDAATPPESPDLGPTPDAPIETAPSCGPIMDQRPACAACVASRCCRQAAICGADPLCLGCGSNPLASCLAYPPSAILTACLATCAGDPCGAAAKLGAGNPSVIVPPVITPVVDGGASDAKDEAPAQDVPSAPVDASVAGDAVAPENVPAGPDAGPRDAGTRETNVAPPADASSDANSALIRSGCGCDVTGGAGSAAATSLLLSAMVSRLRRRARRCIRRR